MSGLINVFKKWRCSFYSELSRPIKRDASFYYFFIMRLPKYGKCEGSLSFALLPGLTKLTLSLVLSGWTFALAFIWRPAVKNLTPQSQSMAVLSS